MANSAILCLAVVCLCSHLCVDATLQTLIRDREFIKELTWLKATKHKEFAFNERFALQMFHLAAAAYTADTEEAEAKQRECLRRASPNRRRSSREGWQHLESHSVDCLGGTCAFFAVVSHRDRQLIFSFRGTNSLKQLLFELYYSSFNGVPFPSNPGSDSWGKINHYFNHVLDNIWPIVRSVLQRFEGYSVTFTGHSLGGALAALAAAQTRVEELRRSDQIRLYTFGQPRIGDYQFAMRHSKEIPNSYRIVNGEDGVVHLGPCEKEAVPISLRVWLWGNRERRRHLRNSLRQCRATGNKSYHQGTEVWYEHGMSLDLRDGRFKKRLCDGLPLHEDITCSAGTPFNRNKMAKYYIADHTAYYGQSVSAFGEAGCNVMGARKTGERAGGQTNEEETAFLERMAANMENEQEERGEAGSQGSQELLKKSTESDATSATNWSNESVRSGSSSGEEQRPRRTVLHRIGLGRDRQAAVSNNLQEVVGPNRANGPAVEMPVGGRPFGLKVALV